MKDDFQFDDSDETDQLIAQRLTQYIIPSNFKKMQKKLYVKNENHKKFNSQIEKVQDILME